MRYFTLALRKMETAAKFWKAGFDQGDLSCVGMLLRNLRSAV
jgi:hypothetical protein